MDRNDNQPSPENKLGDSGEDRDGFGDSVEMSDQAQAVADENSENDYDDGEYDEADEGASPWPQSFTTYEDYLASQKEANKKRLSFVYMAVGLALAAVFLLLLLLVFRLNYSKSDKPAPDAGKQNTSASSALSRDASGMFFMPAGKFDPQWDPIDWYDLKKKPLLYKSLGDEEFAKINLYSDFFSGKETVGFDVTPEFFDLNCRLIKKIFIGRISEEAIKTSVGVEIKRFFREAKIKYADADFSGLSLENFFLASLLKKYEKELDSYVPDSKNAKAASKEEFRNIFSFSVLYGMFFGLGDNYTTILRPSEYEELVADLNEKTFGGIGVIVEKSTENDGALMIVEPLEGTPAYNAGIMAGDAVIAINGMKTNNVDIQMCVSKMKGPKGSSVNLTIKRDYKTFDVKLVRDDIKSVSVTHKLLSDNIGYIKVRSFASDTVDEFDLALAELNKPSNNLKGLIVDVRNNGGGYLVSGVGLASRFVPSGKVVHKQVDKNRNIISCNAIKAPKVNIPSVILVNRFSASASEIFAAAVKDNKSAVVVGERTFGKGSVQEVINQPEGCAVKLTVAYFLSPDGHIINRKGIRPDHNVPMIPRKVGKKDDVQLEKAKEVLKNSI
ncbi:MAG: S41 family peptidase [bacterium]|nr:S41 family peptidase [bacterium]